MAVVCGASTGMSIVTSGGGTSTGGFSNSGGGGGGGSFSVLTSSTMSVWMGGAITSSARRASPVERPGDEHVQGDDDHQHRATARHELGIVYVDSHELL